MFPRGARRRQLGFLFAGEEGGFADDEGAVAGQVDGGLDLGGRRAGVEHDEGGLRAGADEVVGVADGELTGPGLSEEEQGPVLHGIDAKPGEDLGEALVARLDVVPREGASAWERVCVALSTLGHPCLLERKARHIVPRASTR